MNMYLKHMDHRSRESRQGARVCVKIVQECTSARDARQCILEVEHLSGRVDGSSGQTDVSRGLTNALSTSNGTETTQMSQ